MTPQQNKRKGYQWEVDNCDFLRDEYPDVHRHGNLYGRYDRGDIGGVPDWTLQCKDTNRDEWTKWFTATEIQSVSHSTRWWAVIKKARRRSTSEAIFAMPYWKGRELMVYLRDLESEVKRLRARIEELENDQRVHEAG